MDATSTMTAPGSGLLGQKLYAVRQKQVAINSTTGAAITVALTVALLAAAMVADWLLNLHVLVRALILVVNLGILGFVIYRYIIRPIVQAPDEEETALFVEREIPTFRTRLIASVQLTKPHSLPPGGSTRLVQELVAETESLAEPIDFTTTVRVDTLLYTAISATLILLAGVAAFAVGREASRDLLKRAFLSNVPVPRKTQIHCISGDMKIARGDPVTLVATAGGIIPSGGRVMVNYKSGRSLEFPLDRAADGAAKFSRVIENIQESFTYVLRLNDGASQPYHVEAMPRPVVTLIECAQTFPAYTHLPRTRRPLGDLTLLAGSHLLLNMTANKKIKAGTLRLVGLDKELPLQISNANATNLTVDVPIPDKGLTGFSVHLVDEFDLQSKNEAVYRIDILPDKPPTVRVLFPERKEELVTPQATFIVSFEAADDFGIQKASLRHIITRGDASETKDIEFDLAGQSPKSLRRRYEWKLGEFTPQLVAGDTIEFWMEVHDANDATGPGVGTSEHFFMKVVSEAEKRADLMNRLDNYLGSITALTEDQEKLSQSLGDLIREKGQPK